MALAIIRHKVSDFEAWRKLYDSVGPMQKAGGVIEESVYQAKNDPNDVVVLHKFNSIGEAEKFLASSDLKDAMQRAGVVGAPRIEVLEDARRPARV
jgi:quinol monooxygenase YgiN